MTLSDTARGILAAAAEHPNHVALPPARLPGAAQRSVVLSMIKGGLLEEIGAGADQPAWRTGDDGTRYVLRATGAGLSAVAGEPADRQHSRPLPAQEPSTAPQAHSTRLTVRGAAQAVLAAWEIQGHPDLPSAMDAQHTALEPRQARAASSMPRTDTKRAKVLSLLGRAEGATVAQVADATGWARHTVHGFFAGLKKGGTPIEVLERVRQVGPGKQGAAGSYTVYRIGEAA